MNLEPAMMMDILAAAILLFSLIRGARKGFAKTLLSFMQWFVCILAGFFLCIPAKAQIVEYTRLDDAINSYILDQIHTTIEESTPYKSLPDLFSKWLEGGDSDFFYATAASLTDAVLTVISFVGIILAIKILCKLFALIFSKDENDGFIGFLDGFVGFLFGAVRGVLLIYLCFACLVPVLCLTVPGMADPIKEAMDQSYVASMFYDDNLLLILLRDLFS